MIPDYQAQEIERKWQKTWQDTKLYKTDISKTDKKLYCLVMFLYPSGDKLHIGHWYNYGPTDTWARFKKMQGYNVFEPMGYDAFGLPAENYAIKHGIHPAESTENNINIIREQLKAIGAMYDWDFEVNTSRPEYYKWTQWLFLQLYKNGLAYRGKAAVNFCPKCKTVLANEQVIAGLCERCDSEVSTKDLEQWFFRITKYAEQLLEGHDRIDWPEKTIAMQKNWIGKSLGSSIDFPVADSDQMISVFTTRPDTVFGVTYMVLAPEHPLVDELTTPQQTESVEEYRRETRKKKDIDRMSTELEKTGVFTGSFCINPMNGEKVPIWIADYVLVTYGTGAVMAVPGHDERDFEFAKKFKLPIREVISKTGEPTTGGLEQAYIDPGIMINSGQFSGTPSQKGISDVTNYLKENGLGDKKINYKLRDWLISRQRYWGAPIPIIYCEKCGQVSVPEKDLPVLLPDKIDFAAKDLSPLQTAPDFVNTTCPKCGEKARREVDTMDTFVCSSWYFLRYLTPKAADKAFDTSLVNKWLPVDQYVGGAEHAVMHLLYARFFTKALHDAGLINFDEPFKRLVHQGVITNESAKMSKSRGNVINPDRYVNKYGSDTFRMYMMFMGSYEDGGDWSDHNIIGIYRFLKRVWRLVLQIKSDKSEGTERENFDQVLRQMHHAVKHVTIDLERFHFNTSISRIMELVNKMYWYIQNFKIQDQNRELYDVVTPVLVQLMAPFAPHMAEELWKHIGQEYSVFNSRWPEHDEAMLVTEMINLGVQINGKIRDQLQVPADYSNQQILAQAEQSEKVQKYIGGKVIKFKDVKNKKIVVFAVADK
ncbi:leucine--tRNA ligase [candidate division KSB1 bacterium]|nr:leucine--tRNA ligase [candidate division KSB1 bacterium]